MRTRKSKFEEVNLDEILKPRDAGPPPPAYGSVAVAVPHEELIPLDQIQRPLMPKVHVDIRSDGLAKEPNPPASIVRVTVDGAAPPSMPLKLIQLLS
jgi:hypothetical protein